jgi:hypothetical protein
LEEVRKDGVTYAMSFRVNYNGKGILDITLVHSVSAAYPSEFEKNVIIDLESGESIKLEDAKMSPLRVGAFVEDAAVEVAN